MISAHLYSILAGFLKSLCYAMQAGMRKETTEEMLNNGKIQFIQLEEDFSKLTMRVP